MKFSNPACDGKRDQNSHTRHMWQAPRHTERGIKILGKHSQQKRTVKLYQIQHTQCTSACTFRYTESNSFLTTSFRERFLKLEHQTTFAKHASLDTLQQQEEQRSTYSTTQPNWLHEPQHTRSKTLRYTRRYEARVPRYSRTYDGTSRAILEGTRHMHGATPSVRSDTLPAPSTGEL